ncbi:TPA_asm: hypothetical protein GZI09_15890, partial [Listeria monocytogenes]|nr:hypothetical protein [Listeria monocytogenes]
MEDKRKNKQLKLRLSEEDINYIKNKSEELGYKTVSAFVIDSAKNHFKIDMDMSIYRELTKEINYIGKNINSLVRRINSDGFYSDNDIEIIESNQRKIINKMNKEYDRLLNLKKKTTSDNLSLKDKKNLIESLTKLDIEIPKKVVLEELYEKIKDDVIYICEIISKSPAKGEGLDEYILEYISGKTLFELNENRLIEFSNEIFIYTQKLKFKMVNLENQFDDD